jgi:Ala-tRNA(Pro) deacylase
MPAKKLKEFLDTNGVKYVMISHSIAYTSQEIAALAHVRGKDMAKTVIVKLDDKLAMAVLPASHRLDLERLRALTGARSVRLASESEFRLTFPDCETGAMPPFGNLYGVAVYAAVPLAADEEIAFNAGTHSELVRMRFKDFERLVAPTMAEISLAP